MNSEALLTSLWQSNVKRLSGTTSESTSPVLVLLVSAQTNQSYLERI